MSLSRLSGILLALVLLALPALAQDDPPPAPPPESAADAETPDAPDTAAEPDLEAVEEEATEEPAAPPVAAAPLPEPLHIRVVDDPTNETTMAVTWQWSFPPPEGTRVAIEAMPRSEILAEYELSEAERNRLSRAREQLRGDLEALLPERNSLQQQVAAAQTELTTQENNLGLDPDAATVAALSEARREVWSLRASLRRMQNRIDDHRNAYTRQIARGKLLERSRQYEYLSGALGAGRFLSTGDTVAAADLPTRGSAAAFFGRQPDEPDAPFLTASSFVVPPPGPLTQGADEYDEEQPRQITFDFSPEQMYVLRLAVTGPDGTLRYHDIGGAQPQLQLYNVVLANGHVLAWSLALIILGAIFLARRNPNLFIRRIAGLEAVDEAIGRATEMGKPVLYLNGMDPLTELPTLAAINILGRVARRIAEFDSGLLVPVRDPIVMTVAQEVVRSGYMDAGRPDAYREDDVFFVTQDQFSYTASVCGIMLREKPAANFFMGYYYAESLLLAETGQSTGAIQIAGTDSTNQLPFFITTCDYTLIGEELYAASAYLSREPMLLGSLKGLDLAKAVVMVALLLQTVLFLADPELEIIRRVFQPGG